MSKKSSNFAAAKYKIIMATQKIQATMSVKGGRLISASMELYSFVEDGIRIVYCPSLDLSAAGNTLTEAQREFEQIFKMHIEDCIENGTLRDDLLAHGWKQKDAVLNAPKASTIIARNSMLKDIVDNRNYRKDTRSIVLPQNASQLFATA